MYFPIDFLECSLYLTICLPVHYVVDYWHTLIQTELYNHNLCKKLSIGKRDTIWTGTTVVEIRRAVLFN